MYESQRRGGNGKGVWYWRSKRRRRRSLFDLDGDDGVLGFRKRAFSRTEAVLDGGDEGSQGTKDNGLEVHDGLFDEEVAADADSKREQQKGGKQKEVGAITVKEIILLSKVEHPHDDRVHEISPEREFGKRIKDTGAQDRPQHSSISEEEGDREKGQTQSPASSTETEVEGVLPSNPRLRSIRREDDVEEEGAEEEVGDGNDP